MQCYRSKLTLSQKELVLHVHVVCKRVPLNVMENKNIKDNFMNTASSTGTVSSKLITKIFLVKFVISPNNQKTY